MSDVLNPVQLEQAIREVKDTIHRGVDIFTKQHAAVLAAKTEYEHARSQAFLDYPGPQTEKRHAAEVATYDLRKEWDRCEAAFEYTKQKLEAYRGELFALQNLNKGVRAMYNAESGFGS